ncbi:MAG: gliding motility-associated C-terminal domain-containing protein [Bacteroidota bacterium]
MSLLFRFSPTPLLWFLSACLLLTPQSVLANSMMPVFIDPTPNDTTVNCVGDVPLPVDLTANDGTGGMDFEVSPTDDPAAATIDPCAGGTIVRTWAAIIGTDTTRVSQNITVLPDMMPPTYTLATINDTVTCEQANSLAMSNPNRYDIWINSVRVALSSSASDNCGALTITDDGNAPYDEECDTRTITFNLMDACNNMAQYVATYTTLDTIAPMFFGVPPNDTIPCTDMIPAAPTVTVQDNCTPNLVAFLAEATGQTMDGSCSDFEYNILRTWIATDSCGNTNTATQLIRVVDEAPPTYTVPPNITISCSQDPDDLTITGDVTDAMDNCSSVSLQYTDSVSPGICEDEATIVRLWRATDICGNVAGKVQVINVADLQPPSFIVPPDITVDCSEADDLLVTGIPTSVMDDCDPDPDVDFTDDIFPDASCVNRYLIRRNWTVTDRCGQAQSLVQEIQVEDQQPPTFTTAPLDTIVFCNMSIDANQAFNNWVNNHAGAIANDNCTLPQDLNWYAENSGTGNPPSLNAASCPATSQTVQQQAVDFIVEDECGLRDTLTATFQVIDQVPPTISNCPSDFTQSTDPGNCDAVVTLEPPVIEESCSQMMASETVSDSEVLTSSAAPGQEGEVAVDPVDLQLNLTLPLPINASGPATLVIDLDDVDGEDTEEYFRVFAEDGTLLGQTNPTATQCGDGLTTFTLTVAQLNVWATDGTIDLRLEPNLPAGQPERFAINANCPTPSTVTASLTYQVNSLDGIVYEYSVDNGARVLVNPIQAVNETLDQGGHLIRYFATDCAGNTDSCSYSVMITDNEPPVLSCPAPITINVDPDSCGQTLTLPGPLGATDNCEVLTAYNRTLPATPAAALLEFFRDPNLNDYLPGDRTLSFNDVAANATQAVELVIDFQGDFNTNGAFVTIIGDDGSNLGATTVGAADCNTPGQLIITIPAATFNTWASDGNVDIAIVPNDITVPPGVLGDGINPCNPSMVTMDGDTDGISFVTATIRYGVLDIRYYATGTNPLAEAPLPSPSGQITEAFDVGITEVFYLTQDLSGNPDTCSFTVTLNDVTPPTVLCQPTNLLINPSGLQTEVVNPQDVDAGTTDNCSTIDSIWLTPNTFDCSSFGQGLINVTLNAQDTSGNVGTCMTSVAIAAERPMPTANSGLCGGDTLFLFANPPPPNATVYTYEWFDPSGATVSTDQNPVIPGVDAASEGPYRVEITGLTGCTSDGIVNVNIEALPLTPTLQVVPSICQDEPLVLETPVIPAGSGVVFYWYEGIAPSGTLLGTSTSPMFTIPPTHTLGQHDYYLTVEANGCLSPPSEGQSTQVFERPVAAVTFPDTLVCADETIVLGVQPQAGAQYAWTGPNGFTANVQFPTTNALTAADAGFYYVTLNRGLCTSQRDSILVTVKPRPAQPDIGSNGPICSGETLTLFTSATGASAYRWFPPGGGLPTQTTVPNLNIPNATSSEQGTWQVSVVLNGCESARSENLGVVVNPTPVASAGATPNPVCQGEELSLNGFTTVAGSTFAWTGPNGFTSSVANPNRENMTPAFAGTYRLNVTTNAGCTDSTSVNVSVFDNVVITGISDNIPACVDEDFDVLLTSATAPVDNGTYTYNWTFNGMTVSDDPNLAIPNATDADDGDYILEVTTVDGCTSPPASITVDLNFFPEPPDQPFTISGATSFCAGETFTIATNTIAGASVSYVWDTPGGVNITTASPMLQITNANVGDDGMYSLTVIRNGCESLQSVARQITVNPIPTISLASNSPVCEGDVLSLQATLYPTGTYSWFGPSGFGQSVTIHNPIVNNVDSVMNDGIYRVFVEVDGCLSDTIMTDVTVRTRPPIPEISHDAPICLADPLAVLTLSLDSMVTQPGATYTWFTDNGNHQIGGPAPDLELEVIDFTDFATGGLFPFYARATFAGCTSGLSDPTFVQFDTIPDNMPFAGIDTTVCSGDFMLEGVMPTVGSGRWTLLSATDPTGFVLANPDQANTIVGGLTSAGAPYSLEWTLSNGACTSFASDTLLLDVINAEVADAGDNIMVCEDELVFLGATPASADATGTWRQDTTQVILNVGIVDETLPSTEVTGLNPDNFYFFTWVVESVCGTTEDQIFVNVSDPSINAGPDLIICDDINATPIEAEEPAIGSTIAWTASDPAVIISEGNTANPTVSNLPVGITTFVMEIDSGFCGASSRDTMTVTYKVPSVLQDDVASVNFGGSQQIAPLVNDAVPTGATVIVLTPPNNGTVQVTGGTFLDYTAPANFVGTETITYAVISDGCTQEQAIVTIDIGSGASCTVPSIFTPNGDNYNDNFVIPCLLNSGAYPNSSVQIFNKWGDEVYRSGSPYTSDWDGRYNGEDLPVDTYFYVVDLGDGTDPMTGYVMIQR